MAGQWDFYRPLDEYPALFKTFAEIERTNVGVLDFIKQFGTLSDSKGDAVYDVIDQADRMAKRLKDPTGEFLPLTNPSAYLSIDLRNTGLRMQPSTLLDALCLQLAEFERRRNQNVRSVQEVVQSWPRYRSPL